MEEQKKPETEKQSRLSAFMDRLKLSQIVHSPIRVWLSWAGIVLFVGLIIAYYLTTGGN